MRSFMQLWFPMTMTVAAAACGGGDPGPCDPAAQTGCDDGQVCEVVEGGDPACFAPVEARGTVVDLGDQGPVADARVVALDVNRAPVSSVAVSDKDGHYRLTIPSTRRADGTPVGARITLRSDAAGFQSFPGGPRQALPIDTGAAVHGDDGWVIESTQTEIGLLSVPAGAGTGGPRSPRRSARASRSRRRSSPSPRPLRDRSRRRARRRRRSPRS